MFRNLEGLHLKLDSENAHKQALSAGLTEQGVMLQEISSNTSVVFQKATRLEEASEQSSTQLSMINNQNISILHSTAQLLSTLTTGIVTLRSIGEKIIQLFQMYSTFMAEMRAYAQHML